jgi:chemotaxis family two-component system sensor histidine kinase/response regulator PixL
VDSIAYITLPFQNIAEILIPKIDQVKQLGQRRFLYWQERVIPVYRLAELLENVYSLPQLIPTSKSQALSMLVCRQSDRTLALEVTINQLITEPELTIKPLEASVSASECLYGWVFSEDSRLMLAINADALLNKALTLSLTTTAAAITLPQNPPTAIAASLVPTLMVVDDSKTIRKILSLTLYQEGYRVMEAENGQKAISQLRQNSTVQLIICDVEMPEMDGLEFLFHHRQDPTLKKIPVIMLSSRGSETHQQIAMRLGARAYLTKPYVQAELLATIKAILSQTSGVVA